MWFLEPNVVYTLRNWKLIHDIHVDHVSPDVRDPRL